MNNGQLLNAQIDQNVTLSGKAFDAMLGAVVVLDDRTPVYVSGVTRWDSATHGQSIEASGTLRKRSLAADPVTGDDGGISHGIPGTQFVLENAQWNLAN